MIKIKESEVESEITVCPYCMNEVRADPHMGCCGEVHAERAYVLNNGECYLESEIEFEKSETTIP